MTWRLLIHPPAPGAYNMAVDEAILLAHSRGEVPPTLRLYRWDPPAVSIGFSQNLSRKVDEGRCRNLGIGIVRRPTGGRAVLHDKELTYSVVISLGLLPGSVLETYKFLSTGLLAGIKSLGLQAKIEDKPVKSTNPGSPACFDSASWYEIEVSGRKLVGSAQTRRKGVLLQHGSVLLDFDSAMLQQVMFTPNEKVRRRMAAALKERATAINPELLRIGEKPVSAERVEQALIEGFRQGLGINLEQSVLTEQEIITAKKLAETKYSTTGWNLSRKEGGKPCTT